MTNDLDLPLLPSAEQIRRREFATVRRGYDLDQVRDYLLQVADQVETLEKALRDKKMAGPSRSTPSPGETLAAQMSTEVPPAPAGAALHPTEAIATPDDAYERFARKVASVLEAADREAERLLTEAKAESKRIVEQARSEADRVRVDAQARAEEARKAGNEALDEARSEADRILGGLAERRESLVSQMHDMQSKLIAVAKDLEISMDERDEAIRAAVTGRTDGVTSGEPKVEAREETGTREEAEDPVDPRYEDLWADPKGRGSIEIPDLAEIDVDFGEREKD
jgi:DivIVA domain-containing protein